MILQVPPSPSAIRSAMAAHPVLYVARGVVHRDLKPGNVFFNSEAGPGGVLNKGIFGGFDLMHGKLGVWFPVEMFVAKVIT